MYISKNIKFLRKASGLNQTDLGEKVGKTKEAISTYERGKNEPSIEIVFSLARLFDVAVEDLVLRDIEKDGTSGNPAPQSNEVDDDALMKINKLLEKRVITLEREIRRTNPDLADELGID